MIWLTGCAPEHIYDLFQQGCKGQVEMVNSRGIYLELAGKRILLCHSRYGTVPNGVAMDDWEQLPSLLAVGQPVQVEKGVLRVPSGAWELRLRRIPRDTRILSPDPGQLKKGIKLLLANTKPTGLSALAHPLFTDTTCESNPHCDLALPTVKALLQALRMQSGIFPYRWLLKQALLQVLLQALLQALRDENIDAIHSLVNELLGLGPGLTPSGDDLLSGLLYGLRHSPARDGLACTALCDAIREQAGARTNAVSADYLLAILEDAPFDRMAAAWEHPVAGAAGLMQVGSNSGGEMLLGLVCAAQLLLK